MCNIHYVAMSMMASHILKYQKHKNTKMYVSLERNVIFLQIKKKYASRATLSKKFCFVTEVTFKGDL